MPSISQSLPALWFKANVLRSASASVALDALQRTPRSKERAEQAVRNAEKKLIVQVTNGTVTTCAQLYERAWKLGDLDYGLRNLRQPMQRAQCMESVLRTVRNSQPCGTEARAWLDAACHPYQVAARARDVLARAFWAGELNDASQFKQQVEKQAKRERSRYAEGTPDDQIFRDILDSLRPQAAGSMRDFNPQAAVLAQFREQLLNSPAPRVPSEANASDA